MRIFTLMLAALGLLACSQTRGPEPKAPATPEEAAQATADQRLEESLTGFEQATLSHDKRAFMDLVDADYKKVEHDGFFQGVTDNFLNNFFCGQVPGTNQQYCVLFDEISEIRRVELEKGKGSHKITYRVKTPKREIDSRHNLVVERDGLVGFIGSRGVTQVE